MTAIPTSTINTNNPPPNTPVASSVVRANFSAAAEDINVLWQYIYGILPPGGTIVSSFNGRDGDVTLEDSDVINALGFNPHLKMGNFNWVSPVDTPVAISLVPYAEYAFTINRLNNLKLFSGSTTLSIFINGAPVTGLNALAVNTVAQNPPATAANIVNIGDEVTLTLAGTLAANNLKFSMLATV